MLKYLEKHRTLIAIILTLALLAIGFLLPELTQAVSVIVLSISIGMAIVLIARNHWKSYQQAEFTRERMIRNLTRDVIGLLLAMSAAIFAGGQAGQWTGMQAGLWAGLGAGFVVGFLAAWAVRSMWGRLVPVA